jgi:hypothetical protein
MPGEVASETGAEELAPSDRAGTQEPEELAAASDARSIRSALEVPKLQAVLEELAECRRLLAGALKDQP